MCKIHNIDYLNKYNIKNVISAVTGFDNIYDTSINHICLNLIDNNNQNIIHYFEITNYFIENTIKIITRFLFIVFVVFQEA